MINFVPKDGKKSKKSFIENINKIKSQMDAVRSLCNEGKFSDALEVLNSEVIKSFYNNPNMTIKVDPQDRKVLETILGSESTSTGEVTFSVAYARLNELITIIADLVKVNNPIDKKLQQELQILLNLL